MPNFTTFPIAYTEATNITYALRFDETKAHHVNHGAFYIGATNYTTFYWDYFIRPTAQSTNGYVISAGYGGAHNILSGFTSDTSKCAVSGNIWNGASVVSFSSPSVIPLGDWVHIAVCWDLSYIRVYINGVCEGITAYAAANRSTPAAGDSVLYVGGSDHSNFGFDLKWLRGFEGEMPPTLTSSAPFRPERYPRAYYRNGADDVAAVFLADYSRPCEIIPDLSTGFGVQGTHPGRRAKGSDLGAFSDASIHIINNFDDSALPVWVPSTVTTPTTATTTVPVGAKIHDDFNRTTSPFWRDNSANDLPLGSTEGGSLGPLVWQGGDEYYGCSYGRCFSYDGTGQNVYVDSGSQTQDVRIVGANSQHQFTPLLRYTDANNYIFIDFGPVADYDTLYVVRKNAGVDTIIFSGNTAAGTQNDTEIRVTVSGNDINVYYDGVVQYSGAGLASLPTGTNIGFKMTSDPQRKIESFTAY